MKNLEAKRLVGGYGDRKILNGVSIEVETGEVVAVIGHNGAGKSTLLKCIFGLTPVWEGEVWTFGSKFLRPTPRGALSRGLSYIPQGNRVFQDLTVRENLEMGGHSIRSHRDRVDRIGEVCSLFPVLRERLHQWAVTLSGGEKQMLALATALMTSPRVLLADEPSLGLAPQLIVSALKSIRALADSGTAVIVVEQKVRAVLDIADRVCVLRRGEVAFSGTSNLLKDDSALLRRAYI